MTVGTFAIGFARRHDILFATDAEVLILRVRSIEEGRSRDLFHADRAVFRSDDGCETLFPLTFPARAAPHGRKGVTVCVLVVVLVVEKEAAAISMGGLVATGALDLGRLVVVTFKVAVRPWLGLDVPVYARMHARMHACVRPRLGLDVPVYACMHARMHAYACTHTHARIRMHACVRPRLRLHILGHDARGLRACILRRLVLLGVRVGLRPPHALHLLRGLPELDQRLERTELREVHRLSLCRPDPGDYVGRHAHLFACVKCMYVCVHACMPLATTSAGIPTGAAVHTCMYVCTACMHTHRSSGANGSRALLEKEGLHMCMHVYMHVCMNACSPPERCPAPAREGRPSSLWRPP